MPLLLKFGAKRNNIQIVRQTASHRAIGVLSPSRLGDDHLGAELVKLVPQLARVKAARRSPGGHRPGGRGGRQGPTRPAWAGGGGGVRLAAVSGARRAGSAVMSTRVILRVLRLLGSSC